ncbi:unnamed protein product [Moneuplotes crassus]|uniref:Uncharacterized protein n=1 Tax=Euplotes crassus TaxID=5936 RepID=A0AAD2DAR9_EUPCR|nr:unnamed protein product [Moneuplotes crassus]
MEITTGVISINGITEIFLEGKFQKLMIPLQNVTNIEYKFPKIFYLIPISLFLFQ